MTIITRDGFSVVVVVVVVVCSIRRHRRSSISICSTTCDTCVDTCIQCGTKGIYPSEPDTTMINHQRDPEIDADEGDTLLVDVLLLFPGSTVLLYCTARMDVFVNIYCQQLQSTVCRSYCSTID